MTKKIFALIFAAACSLGVMASRPISPDSNWKMHSAFDNLPRRIIDTPERVYFFVHQNKYSTKSANTATDCNGYFNFPACAVFILDKANPSAPMTDLQQLATLSGADMSAFEVDPATGTMVVTYTDGGIDLVTKDGKVTYFDAVKKRNFPGASKINALAFHASTGEFSLATNNGFVLLDPVSGTITADAGWAAAVNDVIPFRNGRIAIIDGAIKRCNDDASLRRLSAYTSLDGVTSDSTPLRLFELSDNHFAFVTDTGKISYCTLGDDGTWTTSVKTTNAGLLIDADYATSNRLERTCVPTSNGYMLASNGSAYQISRPASPSEAPGFTRIAVDYSGYSSYISSYNLTDYWAYRERGEFIKISHNGTTWGSPELVVRPNAPLICGDSRFIYSPKHGFIHLNYIGTLDTSQYYYIGRSPALISSYRDGVWKNLAPTYYEPYYASTNTAFKNSWKGNRNAYPLADPNGVCLDPINPDVLHMGALFNQTASVYLDDPRKYPMFTLREGAGPFKSYPAIKDYTPATWSSCLGTSIAGVDVNNNLWGARLNAFASDPELTTSIEFVYLTADERQEALETQNPTLISGWHHITCMLDFNPYYINRSYVFKHPRNATKILLTMQGQSDIGRPALIYDHKGTLDDTSDDDFRLFYTVVTPGGNQLGVNYSSAVVENPETGEIYMATYNGAVGLYLDSPISQERYIPGRLLEPSTAEGEHQAIAGSLECADLCLDEYGRLWVGLIYGGLYGLDLETGDLVAHYTIANSPLPSDRVLGLGWNPETKTLFASTYLGIAEINVNAPQRFTGSEATDPYVVPANVTPDYTGAVAVRNVPVSASLYIIDADGRKVADLPVPEKGITHWDLKVNGDTRALPGMYRVVNANNDPTSPAFPALQIVVSK